MSMSLDDWKKSGWLVEHRTSPGEISDILTAVDRDLSACRTPSLDTDWRFNIAYNAALQAATAALAAAGYRATREMHHYRVIQSLTFTIGADAAMLDLLDRFRKKRNIGTYERAGIISDHEAGEMLSLAEKLRASVLAWLRRDHADLLR
jgi:hypothetical protein